MDNYAYFERCRCLNLKIVILNSLDLKNVCILCFVGVFRLGLKDHVLRKVPLTINKDY